VRERFAQGWSKSHLAREFRLNRRTVIRICAASSAQRYIHSGQPVEYVKSFYRGDRYKIVHRLRQQEQV
jgi:hypothetical protein